MKNVKMNGSDVLLVGYEDGENLGLRSIAAFLGKHGIRTKIEPYNPSSQDEVLEGIREERPKIVGFSLIFQRMLFEFADMISYLRQNRVNAHFTIGGHYPTLEFKTVLKLIPGLDSVVRNEGEETLLQLFKHLKQQDSWKNIKGLAYRKGNAIRVTEPRPLIEDLDSLPWPVRDNQALTRKNLGVRSMLASRGCYHNCSFCSIQSFYRQTTGPKRRTRSPSNVAAEMEHLFLEHNVCIFTFKDDDLCTKGTQSRKWIKDFAIELKKRKLADKILWRISCRVDEVEAEIMKRLKAVGLAVLYIGIESGSNRGLRTFNKGYTVDDIFRAVDKLRKLRIDFEYGFMLFDPDSTIISVRENINFLKQLGKSGEVVAHFTKMFPYSGAPITDRLKKEGRLKGTLASPDYSFIDPRLNLFQTFCTCICFRNFDNQGLVNRLQMAKFDATVLKKFFPDAYDTDAYVEAVRDLTRQSNESMLELMSIVLHFMQERNEDKIIADWQFLQRLALREKARELQITEDLDWLLSYYGY